MKFLKFRFWLTALFLLMLTAPSSKAVVKNVRNDLIARDGDIIREYIDTSPPFDSAPIRTLNLKETLEEIDSNAALAEVQIDKELLECEAYYKSPKGKDELEKQKTQLRALFTEQINDEQKYKELLENPYVPRTLKDLLIKAKKNPTAIDKFFEEQIYLKILAEQAQQQKLYVRKYTELAKKEARERALRMKLRSNEPPHRTHRMGNSANTLKSNYRRHSLRSNYISVHSVNILERHEHCRRQIHAGKMVFKYHRIMYSANY